MICHMICHMSDHEKGSPTLLEIVTRCHELLEKLKEPDRTKAIRMILLAFDQSNPEPATATAGSGAAIAPLRDGFGRRAQQWLAKNQVDAIIDGVFDVENDFALIAQLPEGSKREQSMLCYLLTGLRALLRTDEAKFSEPEAVALCKREGCYDLANHSITRAQLGKRVTGSKESGFTLTTVGLSEAAALVKKIATA